MNYRKTKLSALITPLLFCYSLHAEPWVDTSNIFLRSNIQLLADSGIIKTPVTTFPLMWHDIARDIKNINLSQLTQRQKNAYSYVSHQFRLAKNNQKTIKLNAASKDKRFSSFGDTFRDNNSISLKSSFMSEHFAANINSSYTNSATDGDKFKLDGSYIAAYAGNWVFSAGMQDRWWGPAWDSCLIIFA